MQEQMDNWSNTSDGPSPKKSRTRTMLLRFLFGVSGFVVLAAAAAAAMVPQLTYHRQETHADSAQSTTQGRVKLHLDPDKQTLTIQANISGAPDDTPLVMHVHGDGSCTGSTLFMLQATSDDTGKVSITMTFNDQQDSTIPSNWYFNVHDNTRQGSDGNPLSIACGPIKVDSSGLIGRAHLQPVQQEVQSLNQTTQSTTEGLITLHLDPNAQTLAVQGIIFDAPSNTPLVMDIHGDGSCTGSTYFTMNATSDNAGHALATQTFNDQHDSTIPSNWYFNVHNTTNQGSDGNPLSIACGPIQTIDSTTAFAKLDPVQQSSVTTTSSQSSSGNLTSLVTTTSSQSSSGNPTPLKTTTSSQSSTEGLTTLHLDPNGHTLTIQSIVFGAPANTPLVMDIHGDGSCTGSTLFTLQATSDDAGNAYATMTFSQDANGHSLPSTIPTNWFFNVQQGPNGNPLSIACGPIELADSSGQTAHAILEPVQQSQTTPPSTTPPSTTVPSLTAPLTTVSATHGTTQGLTVLYLNSAAHTLNVLVHVVGAPPNTPLAMDIHGGGSCTGQTLFMLETVSDNTGNATAIMPFDDQHDTTIPSNWFFNVHDITKQGPDKQPLSIACGPIETPGQVGLAQLSPA